MISSFKKEYSFLSNFYKCHVSYNGVVYNCAETAFQAQKTLDKNERIIFSDIEPGKAKKKGRKIDLREDWEDAKLQIMKEIVKCKFEQNPVLLKRLLETGDEELVEWNNWNDTFWGVCRGRGENHLGIILMEVRKELRD